MVCLGNICRSPVADIVLNARVRAAGLDDRVVIDSYGTGDWHVGKPMDQRSAATLTSSGYDATRHRARQFTRATDGHDLVLAMDDSNHTDLSSLGVAPERLRLFRDFDPTPEGGSVPDPYYGGPDGFADVLQIIERTSDALVAQLDSLLAGEGAHR